LDRQERGGDSTLSAVAELARDEALPVQALVGVDDILEYLGHHAETSADPGVIRAIRDYQTRYGAAG